MAPIAGKYQLVKNENFVEYLTAIGTPEEKAKKADALKPQLEIVIDGKNVSVNSDSGVNNSSSTFVLDQEVDEKMPDDQVLKSTAKLDGDTLTVTSKTADGRSGVRVYKASDSELVLTLSIIGHSLVAKRIYKRV